MAETLRRLVSVGSFTVLQEKLERWLDNYNINTCDQNVNRCVEVLELNARVQNQIFRLLNITAAEGGIYGGSSVIKSRLLPWLGYGYASAFSEAAAKDRELDEVHNMYERSLDNLEADLNETKAEADQLQLELDAKEDELATVRRKSTSEKMFTESEVSELRTKIRLMEEEMIALRARGGLVDTYERQINRLRDDISLLGTGRKDAVTNGDLDITSDLFKALPRPSSPIWDITPRSSPTWDTTQRFRQQKLITRFNDMFSKDRLDAMDVLRNFSDDHENNQRILMAAMQESFTVARLAFASFKMKVRATLAVTHTGPETLEEVVQDYINRNPDLYDLSEMVSDVVRALNRKPNLYLPPDVSYNVVQSFIREACKLAWGMLALPRPLDIAPASTLELLDETKYRRSYDSDYTAPLVTHHVWPCLVQGVKVLMKGEVFAVRGGSTTPRRSRSPLRSVSPSRFVIPYRARSRSPSPLRTSRRLSPERTRSPSRTPSTSLSHYGVRS